MAVVYYMSNSQFKCKWIEFTNPKAHSGWLDLKKARPNYRSTEHILALKTQNGSKERMMIIFQVIGNQKKVGITTLISDKVDFMKKV